MNTYRSRIYERYASGFRDAGLVFDVVGAERWGKAFDWYLRGRLPGGRNAPILELTCGGGKLQHFFKKRGYQNISGGARVGVRRRPTPISSRLCRG